MNITEFKENYSIKNIYYLEPIKNTVIENSNFIRILYSNKLFTLNGLYLYINFKDVSLQNNNNKVRYCINISNNAFIISFIKQMEIDLLNKININKRKIYKISEQLHTGIIKIINNNFNSVHLSDYNNYILKISGLWESPTEYGLTYKFININQKIL